LKGGNVLRLRIEVNIEQSDYGRGGLHLRQEMSVDDLDFLEMAKVLGQFQELAERVNKERGVKK
jgi:hypothetical protein